MNKLLRGSAILLLAGFLTTAVSEGNTSSFGYDGFRRRVTATTGTTTTKFINNSSGQVMSEFDGSGNWLRDYAYLNGKLVAMIRPNPAYVPPDTIPNIESITPPGGGEEMSLLEGGATLEASAGTGGGGSSGEPLLFYYYINDHLGTPWYLTDKSKGVAWSARYYPSGELYFETVSSQTQRYRLPGQYHDQATGLYYNWHRYYDPTVGRYYQADPLGVHGREINQYAYALNNPVEFSDPFGLKTISCKETVKLLREAGEQNLFQAFYNHSGGHKYDFKVNQPLDTFTVGASLLTADEFGNYIAGYAGYKTGGMIGYWGVRAGGVFYDFKDSQNDRILRVESGSRFDWDADSVEDIKAGLLRAKFEEMGLNVNKCECPK